MSQRSPRIGRQSEFTPITFEHGLNEYFEASSTPPGYALTLQNWVPEANGSLRCVRGWNNASTTGLTGAQVNRGVGYFVDTSRHYLNAQASDAATYKIIATSDLAAGTWATADTVVPTDDSTALVAFASGAGKVLYATPGFPSGNIRYWDGSASAVVSTDVIAGRCLAYHNNRFFSGAEAANPTFLRWSELGDATAWTVDTNYQPLGQDDGEPIEDLARWDRNLLIGKEHSVWYQTGFGPDTFAWHLLDGGGCAPGRSLIPTPKGVIAIGREQVWYFAGGGFDPISRPIETSYGMTGDYMSGTYLDGRVYICDEGSGTIWCWDTETGAWHTEVSDTQANGPNAVYAFNGYLLAGGSGGLSTTLYRQEPGSARARNAGDSQTFRALSPEMWLAGATSTITGLHLYLRLRQRDGDAIQTPLTVNYYADGELRSTKDIEPGPDAGTSRHRLDFGVAGRYAHQFEFIQTVPSTEAALFDIEESVCEYQTEGPR